MSTGSTPVAELAFHYYIYYQVDPAVVHRAASDVAQAQAELFSARGIPGRRLRRADQPHLWMEVYEEVSDRAGFEASLAEVVARFGLENHLVSGARRHIECFED